MPLTLKDLPPGSHALVVKGEGGGRFEQQVVLAANDVSVVTATLQGSGAPREKPSAGSGTGRFLLQLAGEGATVFIDGAQLDDGSWKDPIPLRAGAPHEFRITKPKFEEQRFTVTLQPGEDQKKVIDLRPLVGHLEIASDPSGADVNVNGKSAGKTPVKIDDVDVGKDARVTVRLRGYASVTKYVSFERESHQSLDLKLVAAQVGKEDEEGRKASDEERRHSEKERSQHEKTEREKSAAAEKGDKEKGIDAVGESKASAAGSGESGFLVANTQPWAKVLIDGKDTGKTTPIAPRSKIPLKPGKHVVTFVANGKKYNFDVQIKPGEDFRLIRQLDQP
jgi:hypothetical protein